MKPLERRPIVDVREGPEGERGPRGRQGERGRDGKDGRDGISIKGDKGDKGDPGHVAPLIPWRVSDVMRDPVTSAMQSMLMRPSDGKAGISIVAVNDPITGLMVAADIVPLGVSA